MTALAGAPAPYWPCENHQETLLADHGLYWDTVLASFKLLLLAEFGAYVLSCPGAAEQLGACLAWNAEAFYKLAWAAVTELPVQCALCKKWRLLPASVIAGRLPVCVVRVQILL